MFPLQWERGKKLGEGAFGVCYEVVTNAGKNDPPWPDMVVKETSCLAMTPNETKRGKKKRMKEAKIHVKLDHGHIVTLFNSFYDKDEQKVLLFLERMYTSIARDIEENGPYHELLIIVYCIQLLEGLQYLYNQGVFNLDLKGSILEGV